MGTTPLWIPLAAAAIAVVGTLGGVIFTQAWNGRLEQRRWAREDVNRTYEHRRSAYVDFQQELDRLQPIFWDPDREPTPPDRAAFAGLEERMVAITIYGTHEAVRLAQDCMVKLWQSAQNPKNAEVSRDAFRARAGYLNQIREELGVPEQQPPG
jgi:hypothetical protein